MARPKKHADQQKSATVIFRITEAEFERLSLKAQESQLRVNDLARKLTLSRSEKTTLITSGKADPAIIKRLERIGNNINQLFRRAHFNGQIDPQMYRLCEQLEDIILNEIEEA